VDAPASSLEVACVLEARRQVVDHNELPEGDHEEASQGMCGHDDHAEQGWVLALNHVEVQSYNYYSDKVLGKVDLHEAVFLNSAVSAPLEPSEG
jgi:hypothetical protein